jgi:hypothetical protein
MVQAYNKLFLKETIIKENKINAILIEDEKYQGFIVFKDADKSKMRDYISGTIGGDWGTINESESASCKGNKCTIF